MNEDQPMMEDFGSSEEMLKFFQERSEDIENVSVTPGPEVMVRGPGGVRIGPFRGVGMIVNMSAMRRLIKKEDAEILLNDGILNRMGIPIKLFQP